MNNNDLVKISDIFNASYGINLELVKLNQCRKMDRHAVPFVSRTEKNNGVSAYVKREPGIEMNSAHTLSVAASASVLSTFYQLLPYYSGRDLYVLTPKKETTLIEMLFYAKCISVNQYKYGYGRQANRTLQDILIPVEIPQSLKNRLLSFYKKDLLSLSSKSLIHKKITARTSKWKGFKLTELFDIKGSKTTPLLELEECGKGSHPYVTTQATGNGTSGFYNFFSEGKNVLTVDSAVLGYCAYQSEAFSASDHVEKLIPKFTMNKYIAMFLTTVLNSDTYRYNYGRKCSQTRMREINIKLPAKENKPDWQFMEEYIKSIPYSAHI